MNSQRPRRSVSWNPSSTVTRLPVPRAQRLRRHPIYRPLTDPVVQGFIAVMSVALFASVAWALRSIGEFAIGTIAIAGSLGSVGAFLLLVGRAMERDKLVEYWQDRRALRLELRHTRARSELLEATIAGATQLQQGSTRADAPAALDRLTDAALAALAPRHEDVAAVLWLQEENRHHVLRASVVPGTRFGGLRSGTSCTEHHRFEPVLSRLAPHHRAFSVEVEDGELGLALLSYEPFDEEDAAVFELLPSCLSLLAEGWSVTSAPSPIDIGTFR